MSYSITRTYGQQKCLDEARSCLDLGDLETCSAICFALLKEPDLDPVDIACAHTFLAYSDAGYKGAGHAREAVRVLDEVMEQYPDDENMKNARESANRHLVRVMGREPENIGIPGAVGPRKPAQKGVLGVLGKVKVLLKKDS